MTRRHSLIASTNHVVDHTTFSEHLRTTALPAKREAIMGDQALCRAVEMYEVLHHPPCGGSSVR